MLDHISLPVADLEKAAAFYEPVLQTLGMTRRKQRPGAVGYGPTDRQAPVFWLLSRREVGSAQPGIGLHISFSASSREMVNRFYSTSLQHGGRDAGRPGERPEYTMPFYGAFVFDLDGYKIEAVCRTERP